MKIVNRVTLCLSLFISFLFVVPLIFIFYQALGVKNFLISDFLIQFFYVLLQSGLSATISVLIGIMIAVSYVQSSHFLRGTIYLGLLPQILPTIIIIFSYFKLLSYQGIYPQSFFHIVVLHVLINIGLVCFLIHPHLIEQLEKKAHLYLGLQIPKWKYFSLVIIGSLPSVIFYIWILVFSFSITSFSVPLLLSGKVPSSFDYIIYVRGYIDGDWASASVLGIIELIFLGSLFFLKSEKITYYPKNSNLQIFKVDKNKYKFLASGFIFLNLFPVLMIILSVTYFSLSDLKIAFLNLKNVIFVLGQNTFFLTAWTLFFYSLIFWTQAYLLKYKEARIFHRFFWSLTPVLIAFVLLSIANFISDNVIVRLMMTGLTLALFIFPLVFKFWILPEYKSLNQFYQRAEILDISYDKIYEEVIIPYMGRLFKASFAYVLLFSVGDFAISSILLSDLPTLGLSIKNYIQSYQLVEAQVLALLLVLIGVIIILSSKGYRNENR